MEKIGYVTENRDLYTKTKNTGNTEGSKLENPNEKSEKKSIFAGDLNLIEDPIAKKREEAQKQAMKVVQDAWDSDRAIDKEVQDRRDHYDKMSRLHSEAQDEVLQLEQEKQNAKEYYGIQDDSTEQQDVELLCKLEDYRNGDLKSSLTKEEWERVAELGKEPLSEYQEKVLTLHKRESHFKSEMKEAKKQMQDDQADIRAIRIERLKNQPMIEAQENAEKIEESASKEIIGMLQQEALDKMEEEREEEQEKAEEKTEKKEEKEEQLEKQQLERAKQEAMVLKTKEAVEKAESLERKAKAPDIETGEMTDMITSDHTQNNVQQSLEEIKTNMKLLDADLKGIQVDQEI